MFIADFMHSTEDEHTVHCRCTVAYAVYIISVHGYIHVHVHV